MGMDRTRVMTGLAGAVVVAALGVGIGAGQSGTTASVRPLDLDPTCVLGITAADAPRASAPWLPGLLARSDALDREHGLGRHAPRGACADVPDWFRALVLRGDAVNRAHGLGPYADEPR
jgi:hypothetical protein